MTTTETTAPAAAPGMTMASIILDNLRRAGWTVAVHNDFRLNGEPHTFWLLTHEETKRFAKGEGKSDQEALEICAHEAALATDAPVAFAVPELPGRPHVDLTDARRAVADVPAWIAHGNRIDNYPANTLVLVERLAKHLGAAIAVIEDRLAAPDDEFFDAEDAGDALRAGTAAFVGLEGYQTLLQTVHDEHHGGPLATCAVPICVEGRGHLPRVVPPLCKELGTGTWRCGLPAKHEGDCKLTRTVDAHVSFAAGAYGVPVDTVTTEQREKAKLATYMLAYGADAARAAATMGVTVEKLITSAEAVYPTLVPKPPADEEQPL